MRFGSPQELVEHAPCDLGMSREWVIDQERIDTFARASGDGQWIHTDPVRAARGPFGATVAHGFLTLAMTSAMVEDVLSVDGTSMTVNYGVDRVRFPAPLFSGSTIRGSMRLLSASAHPMGVRSVIRVTVLADGMESPCCVADLVVLHSTECS